MFHKGAGRAQGRSFFRKLIALATAAAVAIGLTVLLAGPSLTADDYTWIDVDVPAERLADVTTVDRNHTWFINSIEEEILFYDGRKWEAQAQEIRVDSI